MSNSVNDNGPHSTLPASFAQYTSKDFMQGGGVAIFHIASERVVVCSAEDHHGRKCYFLPKGRRDAGEDASRGAEREGFEESGYRNRLLPLPMKHRQPQAHPRISAPPLTAEPVWIQMMPLAHASVQYLIYWYIAETIPPELEKELETPAGEQYKPPPAYPSEMTLSERIGMEPPGYEPVHHKGTGVDEEEQTYESHLIPVNEAVQKLGKNSVMANVVIRGWKGIKDRYAMEQGANSTSPEQLE